MVASRGLPVSNDTQLSLPFPGGAPSPRRLRVLVADPSRVVQRVAVGILESREHAVTVATTPSEFELLIGEHAFDVVLADASIAGEDRGHARIRDLAVPPATLRLIRLIMRDEEPAPLFGDLSGTTIAKPFHPQELIAAVEQELSDCAGYEPIPDQVLNWEAAVQDLQGREDVLCELARTFFSECESLMKQIHDSLETHDTAKLRRAAHTLKGAANMFCAKATATAARNLECLARDARLADVPAAWSVLQREVGRLIPIMTERAKS